MLGPLMCLEHDLCLRDDCIYVKIFGVWDDMNGCGARAGPCGVECLSNPGEQPNYSPGHKISRGTSVTDFPFKVAYDRYNFPDFTSLYFSCIISLGQVDRPILEKYIVQSLHNLVKIHRYNPNVESSYGPIFPDCFGRGARQHDVTRRESVVTGWGGLVEVSEALGA